jgi:hypothetical protein
MLPMGRNRGLAAAARLVAPPALVSGTLLAVVVVVQLPTA